MTFHPDGQPNIPHQLPVPSSVTAQPSEPGEDPGKRTTRVLIRASIISSAILAIAVLVFVLGLPDPDTALIILVIAALVSALQMSVTLLRDTRRRQREQGSGSGGSSPVHHAPAATGIADARPGATADLEPEVGDAAPEDEPGAGILDVEDVFTIAGRGTVVTGRVRAGTLTAGQFVSVRSAGATVITTQIAGIEQFRRQARSVSAGEQAGLLLDGLTREQVRRGDEVVTAT